MLPVLLVVLFAVVGFPIAFVLLVFLLRYNCSIDLTDNLLCTALYFVMKFVPEKKAMENDRKGAREAFRKWVAAREHLACCCEKVRVPFDGYEVEVWSTQPKDKDPSELATILYFHGGGMKTGYATDSSYKNLVEHYGHVCVVASAEYRISLDGHKYPKSIEDCMAAIRALSKRTPCLMLTGVSAGGYMTIATALRCRDERIPVAQIVPMSAGQHIGLDPMTGAEKGSASLCGRANSLSVEFYVHCLKELWVAEEDWHTKAEKGHDLRTWDYRNIAPCTLICGSYDITHAENVEIAERINMAGGTVSLHVCRATHCYFPLVVHENFGKELDAIFLHYAVKKGLVQANPEWPLLNVP